MEKRIEIVNLKASEIKNGFGNPRKINKKKREELKNSLETFGDFGCFLVDEHNNVIGGNQRLAILKEQNPDTAVLCKRLIGYTENELKAINIRDNTHSGEWDLDLLAEWTADLTVDLGLEEKEQNPEDRKVADLDPIAFEKYDYVMVVCRSEMDYNDLTDKLGISGKKVKINEKKRVKARAIWYDDIKGVVNGL